MEERRLRLGVQWAPWCPGILRENQEIWEEAKGRRHYDLQKQELRSVLGSASGTGERLGEESRGELPLLSMVSKPLESQVAQKQIDRCWQGALFEDQELWPTDLQPALSCPFSVCSIPTSHPFSGDSEDLTSSVAPLAELMPKCVPP